MQGHRGAWMNWGTQRDSQEGTEIWLQKRGKYPAALLRPVRIPEMTKDLGLGRTLTCWGFCFQGLHSQAT